MLVPGPELSCPAARTLCKESQDTAPTNASRWMETGLFSRIISKDRERPRRQEEPFSDRHEQSNRERTVLVNVTQRRRAASGRGRDRRG